jgi:hypothetical protein
MKLVYQFSKKLNYKQLDRIVELYKKSYEINSNFHDIKLYTDMESVELLESHFNEIEIVDTSDLLFLDDLKFKVLPKISNNEILCDGDLFLRKKLNILDNVDILCDILFEIENTVNHDFYDYYRETSEVLVQNGIKKIFPFYENNLEKVINVGLLWFRDKRVKNDFVDNYFLQKNWIIENGLEKKYNFTKDYKKTVTFSQYFLTIFANEKQLQVKSFRDYCDYIHYSGDIKFEKNFMKRFEPRIF